MTTNVGQVQKLLDVLQKQVAALHGNSPGAETTLHAARQFDYSLLEGFTRGRLKMTDLRATSHGTISGKTVAQVDEALEAAGIVGRDAIAIKLDLGRKGIMKTL